MTRIGIIGLGKMGLLHASLVSAVGARVVAVCERHPLLRRFVRKMLPGVAVVREVADLRPIELDAAYVTTPPGSHFSVVSELISQRLARHIFVEKPLAATVDEARELCAMVRRTNGTHMVGYHKRFAVTFRKAKEIVTGGLLGDVVSFEAYAYSSDLIDAAAGGPPQLRGGVLRDLGCHTIDMLLWFFGGAAVTSASSFRITSGDPVESITAELQLPSGASGVLKVSACMADYRLPEIGVSVAGARGRMRVNDDWVELDRASSTRMVWHRHTLTDQVPFLLADPEYTREDQCFLRGVVEGRQVAPSFDDGLRVDVLIDQIEAGLRSH